MKRRNFRPTVQVQASKVQRYRFKSSQYKFCYSKYKFRRSKCSSVIPDTQRRSSDTQSTKVKWDRLPTRNMWTDCSGYPRKIWPLWSMYGLSNREYHPCMAAHTFEKKVHCRFWQKKNKQQSRISKKKTHVYHFHPYIIQNLKKESVTSIVPRPWFSIVFTDPAKSRWLSVHSMVHFWCIPCAGDGIDHSLEHYCQSQRWIARWNTGVFAVVEYGHS